MELFLDNIINGVFLVIKVLPLVGVGVIVGGRYLYYSMLFLGGYVLLSLMSNHIPVCMGATSGCIDLSSRMYISGALEILLTLGYVPILLKIREKLANSRDL